MPYFPPFTGGGSSTSAGLMGTANFLVTWSSDPLISNEKVLTAGANITITTAASTITIAANTGGASNSAGLMGTGGFFVGWATDPTMSAEKVLTAGSSVTLHTDATSIYVNAITNAGVSGVGELILYPQQAKLYSNNSAARIDAGTPVWRLLYAANTMQYGIWQFPMSQTYGNTPRVRLFYSQDSSIAVARTINWLVDTWGYTPNLASTGSGVYIDTYGATNSVNFTLAAGYSAGVLQTGTITLSNIVSFNAGNLIKLRIACSNGGVAGNAELLGANFEWVKV